MKKTLVAMAILAVAGAASAEVKLTGAVGFGISKDIGGTAALGQTDAGLGFSATEDLGGGLSISAGAGLDFNARSAALTSGDKSLALSGGFGKLEFKDFNAGTPLLGDSTSLATDVNGYLGGDSRLVYVRYTAPELAKGLTLQVATYKKAADIPAADLFTTGTPTAFKATYALLPNATVAAEYRTSDARTRLWGSYDAGFAKLDAAAEVHKNNTASSNLQSDVAVSVPLSSSLSAGVHYGKNGSKNATAASVVYSLSKLTNVNFSVINGQGGAVEGTGVRVRLLQAF